MPRPRKHPLSVPPALLRWADALGEAMGRAMARAFNQELSRGNLGLPSGLIGPRRRGRPPKAIVTPAPPEKRCKVDGCLRPARSRGLCSAHYQAERRKQLATPK